MQGPFVAVGDVFDEFLQGQGVTQFLHTGLSGAEDGGAGDQAGQGGDLGAGAAVEHDHVVVVFDHVQGAAQLVFHAAGAGQDPGGVLEVGAGREQVDARAGWRVGRRR